MLVPSCSDDAVMGAHIYVSMVGSVCADETADEHSVECPDKNGAREQVFLPHSLRGSPCSFQGARIGSFDFSGLT